MNLKKIPLAAVCLLALTVSAQMTDLKLGTVAFRLPASFVAHPVRVNFGAEAHCVSVSKRARPKQKGILCNLRDLSDIETLGVFRSVDLASGSGLDVGTSTFVATTVMSRYPMSEIKGLIGPIHEAVIDCDIQDGPIYRPTASCHETVIPLRSGVIYSNFPLKNEVTGQAYFSRTELEALLTQAHAL